MPHHFDCLPIPIEVRPHIRATMAAGATDESRLYIGQPGIIRPAVAIDRERMAAAVVSAIDQQPTDALFAHVGKGDLSAGGPWPMIAPIMAGVKPTFPRTRECRLMTQSGNLDLFLK